MDSASPLFKSSEQDHLSSFTIRDVLGLLFKHKRAILAFFLIVTVIVAAGLIKLPPTYHLESKVLIKTEQEASPAFFSGVAALKETPDRTPVNRTIETEMELIESRSISEEVVTDLKIGWEEVYHKPIGYYLDVIAHYYNALAERWDLPFRFKEKTLQDIVTAFNKSIEILPTKSKSADTNSNIIRVNLRSPGPKLGVAALERLLEIYRDYDIRLNLKAGRRAYEIVEKELQKVSEEIDIAQKELTTFLTSRKMTWRPTMMRPPTGIFSASRGSPGQVENSLLPPDIVVGEAARWASNALITTPRDVNSISLIKARLIEMEIRIIELRQKYPETDSRIVSLKSSIKEIRNRLGKEVDENAKNEATLITLERNLETPEAVYRELKKRLTEISLFMEANENAISNRLIVEQPIVPSCSDWKRKVFVGIAGSFGGLVLGLFVAGFREYNDHTMPNKEEVKKHVGLDVIAVYPVLSSEEIESAFRPEKEVDSFAPPE